MLIQVRYTDPRSQEAVVLSNALTSFVACDQGSVVVLRRRTSHSSFEAIASVNCNLNYSGLNPTATTSDPRSM